VFSHLVTYTVSFFLCVCLHRTVRALCRYDALLKNVTNLHELLDNGHDLPDSPGVQKLLEKMQVDVNYYYDIQADLNSEIEEAVAMLKSAKRWAILKYHAKWVCSGLVLGGSYGLMCYKTGSYVDWRSCTLGGTVVAATIATGLYKLNSSEEQNKVRQILLLIVQVKVYF
jgi:hypothetical protein